MNQSPTVLVIDDDESLCRLIAHWLKREDYEVPTAGTAEQGLATLAQTLPDAVLLDVNLPDDSGLRVLSHIKERHPRVPVVMITADDDVDSVVTAMQAGAWDYLSKPLKPAKLLTTTRNAVDKSRSDLRIAQLEREAGGTGFPGIVGSSPAMRTMYREMDRVAPSDITVLIRGESGSGKERVASALHAASSRRDQPFIALNCAAIPETLQESELFGHEKGAFTGAEDRRTGRFEQANGGTLLLDEVGELSPSLQAKLLRALQERSFYRVGGSKEVQVDVRIIAATHRDLREMVEQRTFREDLYYRIAVFELEVPPLRERGRDVLELADRFLSEFASRNGGPQLSLDADVRAKLLGHPWPGNVRELRNAMERASVLARDGIVRMNDLPPSVLEARAPRPTPAPARAQPGTERAPTAPIPQQGSVASLADMERQLIVDALARCNGNVSEVVRTLGIPRTTLYRRLKEYGLR